MKYLAFILATAMILEDGVKPQTYKKLRTEYKVEELRGGK